jgi:hypothetical protein
MDKATKERFDRIETILEKQAVLMLKFGENMQTANERMTRIETSLDALIRAIATEHTNGKGKV